MFQAPITICFVSMQAIIFGECHLLFSKCTVQRSRVAFANHVLIINLACADFFMGVYMLSISIVDALYNGVYCLKSVEWLYSYTCSTLGALVVLSSQASVLTLVVLSTVRLITVLNVSNACIKFSEW